MATYQDWLDGLSPASFAGVPFAVHGTEKEFGRRGVAHEYPFRDTPWLEGLGRRARRITIRGFLIADSAVYGGGSVFDQEKQLIAAAEAAGPFKLVHPTLGELTVDLPVLVTSDDETANRIEFTLTVTEAGTRQFPSSAASTADQTKSTADDAEKSAASDFNDAVTPQLGIGGFAAQLAQTALGGWTGEISSLAGDATNLFQLASQMNGPFGRFFNGGNLGGLGSAFLSVLSGAVTIDDLAEAAANVRGGLASAITDLVDLAGNLGQGGSSATPDQLSAGAQALVAQLASTAADPAQGMRILTGLAQASPVPVSTPIGSAVGDLMRRSAVAALARASAAYQPTSYDDANAVRAAVTAVIDDEIQVAGDQAQDASFGALRALRVAVVQDLTVRGASLAAIETFSFGTNLPVTVLAQRIYRDPSRSDGLLTQMGDVPNPLFCPASFAALAS
ncbi:MAG TPA: DNA circularization N-terminal domain-containing protein [Bradyrhizobium sp.]|nr:DNA circularization N-terminal domain-containing protein [Bradyrhizobium sp.]